MTPRQKLGHQLLELIDSRYPMGSTDIGFIKFFLAMDIDVNISRGDDANYTLLMAAIHCHCPLEVIEALLDLGADIDAASKSGVYPLLIAVYQQRTDMVELLLRKGASQEPLESDLGMSLTEMARDDSNEEIVKLLEKYQQIPVMGKKR